MASLGKLHIPFIKYCLNGRHNIFESLLRPGYCPQPIPYLALLNLHNHPKSKEPWCLINR